MLADRERIFGADHPDTKSIRQLLDNTAPIQDDGH